MADYINQLSEQGIFITEMNLTAIVTGLLLSLILSYLLSLVYNLVNYNREENYVMMQSLILLSLTIAGAMMIIGNNLARAFGLVGAVSIIRFRLALKTTTDMAFVLITIVIGMASGLGFVALAVIFTFVIGAVLLSMKWLKFGHRGRHVSRYEADIDYDENDIDREGIEKVIALKVLEYEFNWSKKTKRTCLSRYCIWIDNIKTLDRLDSAIGKLGKNVRIEKLVKYFG